MARILQPNERLVQVGAMGLRSPDGSIETIKTYMIVGEEEINKKTGLTAEEEKACRGIVRGMAEQFGEYVRGVEELERKRKAKCQPIY